MLISLTILTTRATPPEEGFVILFTHDLHDHILPFEIERDGETFDLGGYARLQSAIDREREIYPESLLVDAGDFSMGTLFQTIFTTEAPSLRMMGQIGYDAITFGNVDTPTLNLMSRLL